jgi:hypothetical protein
MQGPRVGSRARRALAAGVLITAIAGAACSNRSTQGTTMSSAPISVTEREARDALALALAYLSTVVKSADEYRLVSVQNILVCEDASPARWLVGFKLRSLIPATDDGKIGKGGDLFVEVNTTTRQAVTAKGGH